jgi:pimeloyl-ACP methyl ester carboxylesterase
VLLGFDTVKGEGQRWIVFLHAFGTNRSMWLEQMEALPEGWSGLAYDMRGFGDSDAPSESSAYSMDRLVADLVELLDSLHIQFPVLCGLSLGASVALAAVRAHSARFEAVVLASFGAGLDNPEAAAANGAVWAQLISDRGVEAFANALIEGPLFTGYAGRGPREHGRISDMLAVCSKYGLVNTLQEVTLRRAPLTELLRDLPAIKQPVLVIVGAEDAACRTSSEAISAALPHVRRRDIRSAGHFCNLERSADFNAFVTSFLEDLPVLEARIKDIR